MFYTYIHRRASDGRPFYVGNGSRLDRMSLATGRSVFWTRTKDKHGFRPELVASWPTESQAFEHERFLIDCFRGMGYELCNHTDGGEGASGFKQSQQTKDLRNGKLRGIPRTEATKAKMRQSAAGRVITAEQRKQISATLTGKYCGGDNPMAKPVKCVETGEIFSCMSDAGDWLKSQGNAKASFKSVSSCISGEKKTAYKYRWVAA